MKIWLRVTMLAALAIAGCDDGGPYGDEDAYVGGGGFGGGGGYGGSVGDDVCADGCLQLESCDLAMPDEAGNSLSTFDCAEQCRNESDYGTALCLAEQVDCDADAIDACLSGDGVDLCQQACGFLASCETCITDENGDCYDDAGCVAACNADGLGGAQCLVDLAACDSEGIEACLEEDDGAGDDACADACRVLDGCGQCLLGEDEACVSVADCAITCRADWADGGACLNGLEACDDEAVLACLDGHGEADNCMLGCIALDDCGFCIPDDNDECLTAAACAEQCRENDATENACLRELEGCEEEAVTACLEADPEPPVGEDECARACAGLDGCGLCWTDANEECLTLGACAEACRGGDIEVNTAACLSRVSACGDEIDACFDAPASVCQITCDTMAGCGLFGEESASAVVQCVADCEPDSELMRCRRDATECSDIEACAEAPVDPCQAACERYTECTPAMPVDELAQCVAACADWVDGATTCITEAAECADVTQCALEAAEPSCEAVCTARMACEDPPPAAPDEWLAECATGCAEEANAVRACVIGAADCDAIAACSAQ